MQVFDPLSVIYKSVGSEAPYYRLVDEFYAGVEKDLVLRPIYPEDLTPGKKHLAQFLIQRTGGATTYSDERGHPRMRGRHMPFKIGQKERDAWVKHMTAAVDAVPEFKIHSQALNEFFSSFATFMINQDPT